MGGCCSCLTPKKSDLSPSQSPTRQSRYGTIDKSGVPQTPKETERLLTSGSSKRVGPIPQINVTVTEQPEDTRGREGTLHSIPETAGPSEPQEKLRSGEAAEGENAALVANAQNRRQEKESKKKSAGEHKRWAVVSQVRKATGKMKRSVGGKNKGAGVKQKEKKSVAGSPRLEKPKLERVSSSKMKSKYARERLEQIEKEREKKEKEKHHSGGFRDPRKAAIERGEKLGELDDATSLMRNQAQGFASTTEQLLKAMKK